MAVRDVMPLLVVGVVNAILVLFVFSPWETLAPVSGGTISRFVTQFLVSLNLPAYYVDALRIILLDGYTGLLIIFTLIAICVSWIIQKHHPLEKVHWLVLGKIGVAGLVMLCASLMVGASSGNIVFSYLDRITFGRIIGVALLYMVLLFAIGVWLKGKWRRLLLSVVVGSYVAIGAVWLWMYQDFAHVTRGEIQRLTTAILQIRQDFGSPLYMIIVTEPDWQAARFIDASDVIVHEMQQNLWVQGGDVIVDILHTGAQSDEYLVYSGTCETMSGEVSAGICLHEDGIYSSRWAYQDVYSYNDVVVVRYNHETGHLKLFEALPLDELDSYNIASTNKSYLESNLERVLVGT